MPNSSRTRRMKAIISEVSRGFMPAVGSSSISSFGLSRERAADLEPPLLAIGEIAREHVAPAAQPDELQELQRLLMRRGLVASGVRRVEERPPPMRAQMQMHADQQVLDRGDVAEQPDVLIGAADARGGDAIGRQPVDPFAANQICPRSAGCSA